MKFGVCGLDRAAIAAQAGYDYVEGNVVKLLRPLEPEDAFTASLDAARAAEIPCSVANGFVPPGLKITGPEVDMSALQAYVSTAMTRAQRAGVEVIVFGSGGAREIPDGFDRDAAHDQIVSFCRMVAPLAHDHGVTVAVEPLRRAECNVLNAVGECAELVREVAHPGMRLLVDAYHLMQDNDPYEDIVANGGLFEHVHIATKENRRTPGAEPCDFAPFFDALNKAGYKGRVSIEGRIEDPASELGPALTIMRELAG